MTGGRDRDSGLGTRGISSSPSSSPDELREDRRRSTRAERRRAVARRCRRARRRCASRSGRPTIRSARPNRRWQSTEAQRARPRRDLENARLTSSAPQHLVEAGRRVAAGARSGAHGATTSPRRKLDVARASRSRRSAPTVALARVERRAGRGAPQPGADQRAQQQAAAAAQQRQGRRPARATPRSTRRSTASSTCAPRGRRGRRRRASRSSR